MPAISLPLCEVGHLPCGVCIVGRPGEDEVLLGIAAEIAAWADAADLARRHKD